MYIFLLWFGKRLPFLRIVKTEAKTIHGTYSPTCQSHGTALRHNHIRGGVLADEVRRNHDVQEANLQVSKIRRDRNISTQRISYHLLKYRKLLRGQVHIHVHGEKNLDLFATYLSA